MGPDGSARTYAMWLDGRPIAVALGLAHRNALLVILGGFDFDFKNMSIGSLMFEQIARDCIERGETFLDFTIGDEPYKLTFGSEPSAMWQISRSGSPLGYTAGLVVENLPAAKVLARRLFHGTREGKAAARNAAQPTTPAVDEIATS
jgi:CelD/BcsL family acetyltransferase involved in cellulose biosynthesis